MDQVNEDKNSAIPTGELEKSNVLDADQDWAEIAAKRVWSILQRESERPLPVKTIEVIIREAFERFGNPERNESTQRTDTDASSGATQQDREP